MSNILSTSLSTRLPARFTTENTTAFNVVVAYDDVAMGVRAKHVLDSVTRTLEPDCYPVVNIWKFSMLHQPGLADSAVLEAVAAHMIILALCEDDGMSPETKAWIETWLLRRASTAGALILLLDPAANSSTDASPTHCYLLDVGKRGNLDVFALRDESDWEDLKWVCGECNQLRASSPRKKPRPGPSSNGLGQRVPHRHPLPITVSAPGVTRTIQVG